MDSNRLPSLLERMARDMADVHRRARNSAPLTGANFRKEYPNFQTLISGMAGPLAMIYRVVRVIEDSEDVLDSLDPEEDIEEYAHAKGELYAAKALYLNLKQCISDIEADRVLATSNGRDQQDYFYKVEEHNGVVGEENMRDTGFIGRMIGTTNTTFPSKTRLSPNQYITPKYVGINYIPQAAQGIPAIPSI